MPAEFRTIHAIGDSPERIVVPEATPPADAPPLGFAGLTDAGRGYEMQRPRPPTGHVIVCYGGAGEAWVNGTWQPCGEGQAYVAPPLMPMGFRTIGSKRWQFAWVYLPRGSAMTPPVSVPQATIIDVDPRLVVGAIEGLYLESTGDARPGRMKLWNELVYSYVSQIACNKNTTDPLWKLWSEVDARLADEWTLERLAETAGLHPETLRRIAIRSTGRSPMRHVTHLRMRRAETLLQSRNDKLMQIAQQVGYANQFAFSTAFHRWKGQPPAQLRHSKA